MTTFYLYDDAHARRFEPFATTRPTGELRAGPRLIRERWERALGATCAGFVAGDSFRHFSEPGAPRHAGEQLAAGAFLVNARCVPSLRDAPSGDVLRCGERVAAVRLGGALDARTLHDGTASLDALAGPSRGAATIDGWWLEHVWDLLADMEARLRADLEALTGERRATVPTDCRVLGGGGVFVADDATVEPFVTFDCSNGPVVIESGATVQSFTRVQGPTWVGPHTIVGGDRVSVCAIGEHCKVHGEVSNTVFVGHANKAHDGFVGHSYLGRWVNLGANTVTSNLKNTYGRVAVWTPDGIRGTTLQFLGTLFGDHAKTGIGMTLTTGTVVGAGAQIYGAQMPPKVVPPFAWGNTAPYGTFALDKFLVVAERVMARRHVTLDDDARRFLGDVFAARWSVDT